MVRGRVGRVVVISARGGGLRALAWPHGSEGEEELGVTNARDEGLSVEGGGSVSRSVMPCSCPQDHAEVQTPPARLMDLRFRETHSQWCKTNALHAGRVSAANAAKGISNKAHLSRDI